MRRPIFLVGLTLFLLGALLVGWKTLVLDLPLTPGDAEGLWRVELEIHLRGESRGGSVRAALPRSLGRQVVSDEYVRSDRLRFAALDEGGQRIGLWTGNAEGTHVLSHGFRVRLLPAIEPPIQTWDEPPPVSVVESFGGATPSIPARASAIASFLLRLDLRGPEDPVARARTLFAFVEDQVEFAHDGTSDALLALSASEANEIGKARLLTTLLRGSEIPARVVRGLLLRSPPEERSVAWVEAWLGSWVPMSPTRGFLGETPRDLLVIRHGDDPLVSASGVAAIGHQYRVLRERLGAADVAALMTPASSWLRPLSLYRLPLVTQRTLRVLLVVPLGALVLAAMRNLVGVPTFGTFLAVLVALALRESDLGLGLVMVATVIALGWLGRLLMDRLHLLLVPRLCILLCLVVLMVTGFALIGEGLDSRNLYAGILLPIVIITMLIERFSITAAEEGLREAMTRLAWTAGVSILIYPLFQSETVAHLFFSYPELVLSVAGVLVWIGGYTGYRLMELVRFRSLVREEPVA
ncbi:MAG: UUP1 family membrane protein [Myxococcota bacterium]